LTKPPSNAIINLTKRKAKGDKEMRSVAITKAWFEDIKDRIYYEDPFFYMENGKECLELDVDEEEFNKVSLELGWM
jgi:hypothetical protein